MTVIKIYEYGDTLFFLTDKGFQKGKVKRTMVVSEHAKLKIEYWLLTGKDDPQYQGHYKRPDEVFETYKEMIDYYAAGKIE